MTPDQKLPELNQTELDVLKLFWKNGRLSARELHEKACQQLEWSYSTTRTVLERMARKGLLNKEQFHGLYLYTPAISKPAGLARFVRHFAEHVLETDLAPVVNLFASGNALTEAELADLTRILEESEQERS